NSIDAGLGTGVRYFTSVDAPALSPNGWYIHAQAPNTLFDLTFGSMPVTGTYTITYPAPADSASVSVNIYQDVTSGSLTAGAIVYVNQTGTTQWEITICSAPWTYWPDTYYLTAKFTCPL